MVAVTTMSFLKRLIPMKFLKEMSFQIVRLLSLASQSNYLAQTMTRHSGTILSPVKTSSKLLTQKSWVGNSIQIEAHKTNELRQRLFLPSTNISLIHCDIKCYLNLFHKLLQHRFYLSLFLMNCLKRKALTIRNQKILG